MGDFIDREARAKAADALRQAVSEGDVPAPVLSSLKTTDKAIPAALKAAAFIMKTAAKRGSEGGKGLSDAEKKQIEFYALFLESGAEMADPTTKITGRSLSIAVGVYLVLVIGLTCGFWFALRNWVGALCAAAVVSAFIYALGVLAMMIGSVPQERRRAQEYSEDLQALGVRWLWPFASIADLKEALARR
ncbi:MAG: hypothetical protein Q7T82_21580 [Armatimonadota bacterium]|nr:hypothetical protein [Armatimonadota bacterium]